MKITAGTRNAARTPGNIFANREKKSLIHTRTKGPPSRRPPEREGAYEQFRLIVAAQVDRGKSDGTPAGPGVQRSPTCRLLVFRKFRTAAASIVNRSFL